MNVNTNEWLSTAENRIPIGRELLVRTADDTMHVAVWNGYYWKDYNTGRRRLVPLDNITHFYIFERHPFDMGQTIGD